MKKLLLICVLCAVVFSANATDLIIVRGDTLLLFGKLSLVPDSVRYAQLQRGLDTIKSSPSATARRYAVLWRQDKDSVRLAGIYDAQFKVRLATDSLFTPGTVPTWFSGSLRAARPEKVVFQSNVGDKSVYYQHEVVYTIDRGRVVAVKKYRNDVVGSQKVFFEKTLPAIEKGYVFPDEPSAEGLRNVYIAFAVTPDSKGIIRRFDVVRLVFYHKDSTVTRSDDPFHPYAQALLNRLIDAQPYVVTIHDKIRSTTGGVTVTPREEEKIPIAADSLEKAPAPSDEAATAAPTEAPKTEALPGAPQAASPAEDAIPPEAITPGAAATPVAATPPAPGSAPPQAPAPSDITPERKTPAPPAIPKDSKNRL